MLQSALHTARENLARAIRRAKTIFRLKVQRYPTVVQLERSDCGPAALLSVLRYWGGYVPLADIRDASDTQPNGSTFAGLASAAATLGLRAEGVRAELEQLEKTKPWIAHITLPDGWNHYVVVWAVDRRDVVVGDPSVGTRRIPRDEFNHLWKSRFALLFEPECVACKPEPYRLRDWLRGLVRDEATWVSQAIFLGFVCAAHGLVVAFLFRTLIDKVISERDADAALLTAVAICCVGLIGACCNYARQRFMIILGRNLAGRLNAQVVGRILHAPASFFLGRSTGDAVARLGDVSSAQSVLTRVIGSSVLDLFVAGAAVAGITALAPVFLWPVAVLTPVIAIVLVRVMNIVRARQRHVLIAGTAVQSHFIDTITGIDVVRGFGAEMMFVDRNTLAWRKYQAEGLALNNTIAAAGAMNDFGGALLLAMVLAVGGWRATRGEVEVGTLVAAFALINMLVPALGRLVEGYSAIQGARVALDRIRSLPEPTTHIGAISRRSNSNGRLPFSGAVELRAHDLTFRRGPAAPLFEGLSLRLESGRSTALLGPSGAGKSTLARVLAGDLRAESGWVSLNGHACSEMETDVYRREVVVVTESSKIFNATLRENLLLGRAEPIDDFLSNRLHVLRLVDFFRRFPFGLDTMVGDSGRRISSGERQIVALARALLFSPSVLILDEAANAIDPLLSMILSRCIGDYSKEHAVCVITHDPRMAKEAGYVYVMEAGRIVHEGPTDHPDLRSITPSPKLSLPLPHEHIA